MVFSPSGPPVNAYGNKFYNDMKTYISGTNSSSHNVRELELYLSLYPNPVTKALVRVGHNENGTTETWIEYIENWSGDRWECRWGRHKNSHNSRDHFHYPPDPDNKNRTPYAYDADYGQDVLMMETPIEFIRERINHLNNVSNNTYPKGYNWNNEYQPNKYEKP